MNANELADLLADSNDPDIRRAVAMLRQQQAEIEALRNQLWDLKSEPWGFDRKAQEKCNGFCGEYECKENKAGCKRKAQENG